MQNNEKTIRAHDLMEVNCIARITVRLWSAKAKTFMSVMYFLNYHWFCKFWVFYVLKAPAVPIFIAPEINFFA